MLFSYDSRVLLCFSSYRISCIAAQYSSVVVTLVVFWFCAHTQPVYFKTGVKFEQLNSVDGVLWCAVHRSTGVTGRL